MEAVDGEIRAKKNRERKEIIGVAFKSGRSRGRA